MDWAKPEHSRNQVDKAGAAILKPTIFTMESLDERRKFLHIVNNWRSAHSYPLNIFQVNLRQRARKIDANALVSQRLKRYESLVKKLARDQTSTMELTQMQDIAGCRAILADSEKVYRLVKSYQRGPSQKWIHELVGTGKDYIENPKSDGYRSIHLVFRYKGTSPNINWDRLRVEMQIRSQLQHAWATALEAVDFFTKQALKANQGDERWQRFFALMGSVIAIKERRPLVPGTPSNVSEIREELAVVESSLGAIERLRQFRYAIRQAQEPGISRQAAYYLLHLSFKQNTIRWDTFRWWESQEANAQYTSLEQTIAGDKDEHVVLVRATSLLAMKRAYPGFFLDTEVFLQLVIEALTPLNALAAPHRTFGDV